MKKLLLFFLFFYASSILPQSLQAYENLDIGRLATAVYKAEGGAKTNHPYGLVSLSTWCKKEGSCRYMAMEILRIHAQRCRGSQDMFGCIGGYYAPIGAKNDPNNLNKNWAKNVRYFYETL